MFVRFSRVVGIDSELFLVGVVIDNLVDMLF
jgi:hypothetical protein